MKKTIAKIIGIIIIFVLCSHNVKVLALTAKEEWEKEQEKLEESNSQLENAKEKQEKIEAEMSKAMAAVQELIGEISGVQTEIDELEDKIEDLQAQIKSKERDIEQKEIEYTKQQELLEQRMVAMYKKGETTYLDVLLNSSGIIDFLDKYYMAKQLVEYDKELIQTAKEQKAQIEAEKAELEASKKELDTSLAQQEQKAVELKSLKSEKEEYANQLTAEEKELEAEIEQLEEDNRKIAADVRAAEAKYQAELDQLEDDGPAGAGYFIRPVTSGTITATAYYSSGKFHGAIDYGVPRGTVVMAAADGVVMTTANLTTSYGTYVVIRHANGLQTIYGHGTYGSIVVKPGQIVKKGEKIMLSGNTGNSTGPHLHFEVRVAPYKYKSTATAYGQDCRVNPLNYM